MIKDYTIDYEEYRNRQQTGCTSANDPQRSTTGHCTMMTYYGNNNVLGSDESTYGHNILYYWSISNANVATINPDSPNYIAKKDSVNDAVDEAKNQIADDHTQNSSGFIQSYGQYKALFTDVKDDVDFVPGPVGDDDDRDMGQ